MKKFTLLALAALTFGLFSCEPEPAPEPNNPATEAQPTIALEKGEESINSVSFSLTTTDATEVRYMVLGDEATAPTLEVILSTGTEVALDENGAATVTAEGLEAETDYKVVAAAKNVTKMAGSNTLYFTTKAEGELLICAEIVQVTHESMFFRFEQSNAERVAYLVQYASKEVPTEQYVWVNGNEIDPTSKEAIEVKELENAKAYRLIVVAEGNGKSAMAEPIEFTTKDDPANVIEHNYTRVRGSKYSSNYFLMFSYEDANEADNFAYNDKTLCLDFYGDPDKDYLPAGTYEVKESTEWPCLNSLRYSTYGYENGVLLKSGQVVVSIDEETKAYTFEIDLFLKDGRHLVANYTGDVDNMPVIDIVTIATNFSTASATTTDEGATWALSFADENGNSAVFHITNAYKAPYIAKNSYTISTSAEEFAARPAAAEAGQFDNTTSYFVVAGVDGNHKFAKGTLNVDIDWAFQAYYMTFYGELENGYIIETNFQGSVEGISLAQSEVIIDNMLNKASARSFDNNTNWYITFYQVVDGVEKYRVILDAFCPAMSYLPAGYYTLSYAANGTCLNYGGCYLYINGEGQYEPTAASASVDIDMAAKEYRFDISYKIEDGRTFKFAYVGKVDGMEIVDPEDVPDTINWTKLVARKWTNDNWNLDVKDESGEYTLSFDLRTGDSGANYISSGVYQLNADEAQYIDRYYSQFNGNKNAFSDAVLSLVYNEDSKTYEVLFDVTLTDGRNFTGSYNGAIENSPAQ